MDHLPPLLGNAPVFARVREELFRLASSEDPILLTGETGTGKHLAALWLHRLSQRGHEPMIRIDGLAIAEQAETKSWEFDAAGHFHYGRNLYTPENGCVLLLENITSVPLPSQMQLLHALRDQEFRTAISAAGAPAARIVALTRSAQPGAFAQDHIRPDLLTRLSKMEIHLPPLRERKTDISLLLAYYLHFYSQQWKLPLQPLPSGLQKHCREYDWPGNVRELANFAQRWVVLGGELDYPAWLPLTPASARSAPRPPAALRPLSRREVRHLDMQIIVRALEAAHWNRRRAARQLGMSYRTLLRKIKKIDAGNY